MAYIPTTWVNNETLVTADRMNNIEDGIVDNETAAANTVKYASQSLTDAQKDQARANILAAKVSVSGHTLVIATGGASS